MTTSRFNHHHHPGTSGRSPPPSRMSGISNNSNNSSTATSGRSGVGGVGGVGGGNNISSNNNNRLSYDPRNNSSIGTTSGANNNLNMSHMSHMSYSSDYRGAVWTGMSSTVSNLSGMGAGGGERLRGTRLSFGTTHSALGTVASAASSSMGGQSASVLKTPRSPPSAPFSNSSKTSDFFAALSPSTAQYLRQHERSARTNTATNTATNNEDNNEDNSGTKSGTSSGTNNGTKDPNAATSTGHASSAAATAMRTAGNAPRGIDEHNPAPSSNDRPSQDYLLRIGQDDDTVQLRNFVQTLLGMHPPRTAATSVLPPLPDPASASYYALALLTKTNGMRPDDAFLAARAMAANGEIKRAIWLLDRAGLIGINGLGGMAAMGAMGAPAYASAVTPGEGDVGGGGTELHNAAMHGPFSEMQPTTQHELTAQMQYMQKNHHPGLPNHGMQAALLLRTEAALLAGQCLVQAGEFEKAIGVYEEAMRYPPPPPPPSWAMYGYRFDMESNQESNNNNDDDDDDDDPLYLRHLQEMHIRSWREESLAHTALIDEGSDERLYLLAKTVHPLPFVTTTTSSSSSSSSKPDDIAVTTLVGIHPVARLCSARGMAYDELSNPTRAVPFLRMALKIDPRCIEAYDYAIRKRLLTPLEEREWVTSLDWGDANNNNNNNINNKGDQEGNNDNSLAKMGIRWLKDAYLARLSGGANVITNTHKEDRPQPNPDVSSTHRVGLQTPSVLSLTSPDLAGGSLRAPMDAIAEPSLLLLPPDTTIDGAFCNLAKIHRLGKSPDTLSLAAIRSYASHDLRSALTYCTLIDDIDPFCRSAGYVHVATLVALNLQRRLFQLAHRLVDADPKDALAWFAVGSYYHLCRRYDLAQRHFSRSTRLDPSRAECWIGFGCSFAVCDESDQALASFRAAHKKFSGSHIPLLYMGMEYLRTNHLSLAGHFLTSAQKTDASDPLCCNELGVWSFRRGDLEDAAFWFVKALRLHVEAENSALKSRDEALSFDGYILLNGEGNNEVMQETTIQEKSTTKTKKPLDLKSPEPKGFKDNPPISTVLCAIKTPSGQSIAASMLSAEYDNTLTDMDCIERCKDQFWEPTIFNLGQSYRKMKRFSDAIVCFEKCLSLNPGSSSAYAALGFARHLNGDIDGAIDSYHEALSRNPDDPFSSEMLNRALSEAVTYPRSSVFAEAPRHRSALGRSILEGVQSNPRRFEWDEGESMAVSNGTDVDMSFA